jgi:SAM-dependent methyltransferase
MKQHPKQRFASLIPRGGKVLDLGCWDYNFLRFCETVGVTGLKHYGIDREPLLEAPPPEGYEFMAGDLDASPLPFADDSFDAVVASHVIEHLTRPMQMMDEIFRVLRVGGLLYLECPSTRSLRLPSMPFRFEEFRSLNFYDDPTHLGRPHSPQSLFRLFSMYNGEVLECRHIISNRVRLLFPKLILSALLRRDAAELERIMWLTFGFAVYGITRKIDGSKRRYLLSS